MTSGHITEISWGRGHDCLEQLVMWPPYTTMATARIERMTDRSDICVRETHILGTQEMNRKEILGTEI